MPDALKVAPAGAGPETKALRIAVVGSAIPVEAGTPEQRAAAALRRTLRRFGEVYSAVVDVDGSQLASRGLLQRSMSLTPLRSRATPAALLAEAAAASGEVETFVSRRRLARLVRRIAAFKPDLVVVENPALAGVGEKLRGLEVPLVLCDGGEATVQRRLAAEAPGANEARAHSLLAEQARRELARAAFIYDQVWSTGSTLRLTPAPKEALSSPLVSMGVHDIRLSEKTGPAVLVSSGVPWLDKAMLADLAKPLDGLARSSEEPGLALVGFEPAMIGQLARAAAVDADWKNFSLRLGQARFLLTPVIGPGTAEVVKSALVSGTPVLCPLTVAQQLGFDATAGVYPCRPDALASLLARGVPIMPGDAEVNSVVAKEAEAAFGEGVFAAAVETALTALLKRETRAAPRAEAERRHLRFSPLVGPAKLMFNPVTRMLLLRVKVLKKLGVSEIRILNEAGAEVTRILANVDSTTKPIQEIEGGVVMPRGVEPGDLTVAFYDDDVELHVIEFARDEIERLEGEVFALNLEGTICEGAFWTTTTDADTVWQIEHAGFRARVSGRQGVRIKGVDVMAVPFKLLRTRDSAPGATVKIARVDPVAKTAVSLLQRPALASHLTCAPRLEHAHSASALKDLHKGKRGWMIGNGPSVRLEDLDAIPDDDVKFCFNRFYKCYADTRLRENYVVSADMLMIDDFGQEMVDKSAGLPLFCRNRVISEVSGRYVELQPGDTYLPLFSYDPSKFVSIGGSSVFVAMQMAYFMGVRELFLYGMDFSFSMSLGRDPRYKFPVSFDDNNHFIKGYRDAKPWCPPTWRDISAGFINARAAFELGGGRVLNATRGGKLEIFDRTDFESAVGKAPAAPPAMQKTA